MRYRRDRSAGVIVFHRGEDGCRFLLLLSRLTKRPLWEFPKGGVDAGESLTQAALRELREETGLREDQIRIIPGFEHREEYRFTSGQEERRTLIRKEVTYFLAEALSTGITLSEHEASQFAWLPLEDALRKIKYKARREMLRSAARIGGCGADPE
jgi:8-oxo-dGTP pyrophosphatase MutT (NUDIX family)